MPEYKYERENIISKEETQEMINTANRQRDKCIIALHYLTGARISEIVELKRKAITTNKNEIKIEFSWRKRRDKGPVKVTGSLIFQKEETPFVEYILSYLKNMGFDEDHYIFPAYGCLSYAADKHLSRQRVWQTLKNIEEDCSSHLFRYTRALKLEKKGYSLNDVRKWLGRKTAPVEYLPAAEEDIRKMSPDID